MFCVSGFYTHLFHRTGYFRQLLSRVRFNFLFCLQKPVSLNAYCSQTHAYCPSITVHLENHMHFLDLPFQEHVKRVRAAQPSLKLRE